LRSFVSRGTRWRRQVRREWSFVRAAARHRSGSFVALLVLLVLGAWSFRVFEPEAGHSWGRAFFYTWSLMFGEAPEALPASAWLRVLFFVVPLLGLTICLEAVVEISAMLRDRRRGEREWCRIMAGSMKGHVVLVGVGRLGWRIYNILRRLGCDVAAIERNGESSFLDDVRREGTPLFIGDARREQWLVEANVKEARSIVLASDDDLANLEIALDARRINPGIHVVMRMFDPNMADKVGEGFGIHTAMSASAVAAPLFATAALQKDVTSSTLVGDELVVSQVWRVRRDGPLDALEVGELLRRFAVGVVQRRGADGRRVFFPPPETKLAAEDAIVVQGTLPTILAQSAALSA
jgi:voltage-gated potassium channel